MHVAPLGFGKHALAEKLDSTTGECANERISVTMPSFVLAFILKFTVLRPQDALLLLPNFLS